MRKALVLATGLVLVAGSAWSQSLSRDREDYDGRGWRENRRMWEGDRDRWRGHVMRDDDDDDDRGGDRSGRGARFFLRSGDTQLRVVCGDRESTQACVDAALRMFDRVQSQQNAPSRAPAAPGATPSPQ
jgi:hypothetical protein